MKSRRKDLAAGLLGGERAGGRAASARVRRRAGGKAALRPQVLLSSRWFTPPSCFICPQITHQLQCPSPTSPWRPQMATARGPARRLAEKTFKPGAAGRGMMHRPAFALSFSGFPASGRKWTQKESDLLSWRRKGGARGADRKWGRCPPEAPWGEGDQKQNWGSKLHNRSFLLLF